MAWTPADRPQSKAQLAQLVQEDDVVGIAWGRTVNAMTAALSELKRCSIVQMAGALSGSEVSDNAIELVRKTSQISGGAAYPIYAPLLLDDPPLPSPSAAKSRSPAAWTKQTRSTS
jgi:DNA-binding transcriptional regulator LsrR (DeoR family)